MNQGVDVGGVSCGGRVTGSFDDRIMKPSLFMKRDISRKLLFSSDSCRSCPYGYLIAVFSAGRVSLK